MIAVLGASGQVGMALVELLGDRALPVTRDELDISQTSLIPVWVEENRPDVIINCAAYTAVDAAETNPSAAHAVNAVAVGELAKASHTVGARFVTFSTDYVFDGIKARPYVESDSPNPLSVYGQTKLAGERLALEANPDALVIRTSWVLSGTHSNFAATMIDLIRVGPVNVVDDQRGRPTIASDLAVSVVQCIDGDVAGIIHLTNRGEASWFELAREIAAVAGLDLDRVRPTTTESYLRPAPRPPNSLLDSERLETLAMDELPDYPDSLSRVVAELVARGH